MNTISKNNKRLVVVLVAITCLMAAYFCPKAYAGNDGLTGANIVDGQLLGYYGDGGDIVIPNTVTIIAPEAFKDNDNVTSVTIPGSVQVIGYNAFEGCTALESVYFADPVNGADLTIRVSAFIDCPKLSEIEIPATATYVTGNIFKGCSSLEEIKVHPQNPYYFTDEEGVLFGPWVDEGEPQYDDERLALTAYPCGRTEGHYTIPGEVADHPVNRVWASGFRQAKNLTSVEIPSTIEILGANAFEATGLKEVTIPETVTQIDDALFEACEDLVEVTLPEGMTTIPTRFFLGCTNLVRINMPETINSFEMDAFTDCKSLTTLIMPEGLSTIALSTFDGCDNLQQVVIPPSVKYFPSDEYVGDYDPFPDSPRSLIVYLEDGSAAKKWADANFEDWGYTYQIVADTANLDGIEPAKFYLMDMANKVKLQGNFPIVTTLKVTPVESGAEYDAFAAKAGDGSFRVYEVSLVPEDTETTEPMSLSIGLPDGLTNKAKLYAYQDGAIEELSATMISKTLTADVDALGYFAIIDGTVDSGDSGEVTGVKLNKTTATLAVDGKLQLSATVQPATAANKTITWSSSDDTVATVDTKGVVTAVKAGKADITATAHNGISATCEVTVTSSGTPVDPDDEVIATKAALRAERAAGDQGKAAFSLALSEASRISTVQVTFQTSTDQVSISGKNGFSLIGEIQGEMQDGVYTGTAVLGYLTSDQSLFSAVQETAIAQILVDAETPTVKITQLKVAGWDADKTVAYGTVNGISPDEATFQDPLDYDLTGDGVVDLLDIAEAQKYYRADSESANWAEASRCDFTGDGVISIDDFIEIWINFTAQDKYSNERKPKGRALAPLFKEDL